MKLLVFTPLWVEAVALGKEPGWRVLRSGMGPERARIAAARGLAVDASAVAVVGLCAGVAPGLRAGDVVCATELRRAGADPVSVEGSEFLVAALERRGLRTHAGPIYSTTHLAGPHERRGLDALAVDMESAWLAEAAAGRPLAVLRVVVDEAGRRLLEPRTLVAGTRALANLRRLRAGLAEWAESPSPDVDNVRVVEVASV